MLGMWGELCFNMSNRPIYLLSRHPSISIFYTLKLIMSCSLVCYLALHRSTGVCEKDCSKDMSEEKARGHVYCRCVALVEVPNLCFGWLWQLQKLELHYFRRRFSRNDGSSDEACPSFQSGLLWSWFQS